MKQELIQIIMAFGGTFGFSAFLHIDKNKLIPVSFAGAFTWALFLAARRLQSAARCDLRAGH